MIRYICVYLSNKNFSRVSLGGVYSLLVFHSFYAVHDERIRTCPNFFLDLVCFILLPRKEPIFVMR